MDAIKKKMQSLKTETDNALTRAQELDSEAKNATQMAEKYEENVSLPILSKVEKSEEKSRKIGEYLEYSRTPQ